MKISDTARSLGEEEYNLRRKALLLHLQSFRLKQHDKIVELEASVINFLDRAGLSYCTDCSTVHSVFIFTVAIPGIYLYNSQLIKHPDYLDISAQLKTFQGEYELLGYEYEAERNRLPEFDRQMIKPGCTYKIMISRHD